MPTPTPNAVAGWLDLIESGGLLLVFVALAIGQGFAYWKRWIVPGWLLKERDGRIATLEAEVVQWRTLALQSIGLSNRFASVVLPPTPPSSTATPPIIGGV